MANIQSARLAMSICRPRAASSGGENLEKLHKEMNAEVIDNSQSIDVPSHKQCFCGALKSRYDEVRVNWSSLTHTAQLNCDRVPINFQ